jgi:copper transport protein
VAQGADAGLSVQEFLGSALVRGFVERAVPAVLAIAALVVTLATGSARDRRLGLLVVAALAATVMLMDVDTSHATAGGLPRLNGAFQWLHALGVGVWIGGLAALLVGIRGAPREVSAGAVQRFSAVAGVAVVVVGVTGLIRAGVDVGSVGALTSSLFGQLVLVKICLLSLLVMLGAANRFRHLPRALHTLRGLRRIGSAELGLALVTLIVAGTLVNTVPPASSTSAAVAPRPHPVAKVATFAPEPSSRPSATAGRSNAAPVP